MWQNPCRRQPTIGNTASTMKKILLSFWRVLKNKYVAATLVFLLFFCFLGENNIIVTRRLQREVSELRREVEMLKTNLEQDSIESSSITDNPDALEAYGREHYYMKRPEEDIFIVK